MQDQDQEPGWRSRLGGDEPRQPAAGGREQRNVPWLEPVMGDEVPEEGLPFRKILLGVGVLALMGLSATGGYMIGKSNRASGNLIVQAPDDPTKEQPAQPGGMDVPNQDKLVLEKATTSGTGEEETIRPLTESPIVPPPQQQAEAKPAAPVAEKPAAQTPAPTPAEQKLASGAPAVAPAKAPDAKTPAVKAPAAKVPDQIKAAVASAEPTKKEEPKPAATTGGKFSLSLGAFSTEDKAKAVWSSVAAKSGKAAKLPHAISTVQAGDKTLYRLSAGPVSSKEDAQAICGQVASATQACVVTGK